MGLDNGIVMKKVKREDVLKFPAFVKYEMWDNMQHNAEFVDVEIAYWRKCWGIRQAVIDAFHLDEDDADFDIEAEDIPALSRALYPFLSKEYWDENSDSIWTFDEQIDKMIQILINLKWLQTYLAKYPDTEVKFYDSY